MEEEYEVSLITDFELLESFSCGIQSLDDFIHSGLEVFQRITIARLMLFQLKTGEGIL